MIFTTEQLQSILDSQLMTVKEAAESKGLSYWTVYGAMERGEFERARLPGKHSAVSRASFERWAAQK